MEMSTIATNRITLSVVEAKIPQNTYSTESYNRSETRRSMVTLQK